MFLLNRILLRIGIVSREIDISIENLSAQHFNMNANSRVSYRIMANWLILRSDNKIRNLNNLFFFPFDT